jgi:multidrug efflux pump subunit AcrA (membrane-fusion protein)
VLLPLWHETAQGRFVLEPENRAVIRAMVPGIVSQVNADEGQQVAAGAPLIRLRNLPLESKLAGSVAAYDQAAARKTSALLRYADFGPAEQERAGLAIQTGGFRAEASELEVDSPIAGTVLSARLKDLVGSYVPAGTQLAEVADLRRLRARIYISEYDMNKFKTDASAGLHVDGMFGKRKVQSVTIAPASSAIAPNLMDLSKFEGMSAPNFYVVEMIVANPDGRLAPGMIGSARVYGRRRSIVAFALQALADFVGRKVW